MNMREKAIKELKSLLQKSYMKPFQQELSEKLTLWTQTHKLYLITNTFEKNHNTFTKKTTNFMRVLRDSKEMRTA